MWTTEFMVHLQWMQKCGNRCRMCLLPKLLRYYRDDICRIRKLHYKPSVVSRYLYPPWCIGNKVQHIILWLQVNYIITQFRLIHLILSLRWSRYIAYHQFVRWIYIYGRLGQDIHVPLPSCVVSHIWPLFPSKYRNYMGFHSSNFL